MTTLGLLGGTGDQGKGLAARLAQAGYPCVIGSRDAGRAEQAAAELDSGPRQITGAENAKVAAQAELLLVTVPYEALDATLAPLAEALADKIIVSCVNPISFDGDGPYWQRPEVGSAAQQCQLLLPESRVGAAFHTVSAKKLLDVETAMAGDVPVCADDDDVRAEVVALVDAIEGLRGIHAGALRLAFALETFTTLLIAVNKHYGRSVGLGLVDLPERVVSSD
ncbi:MAG: NADPH-dependent F420 reductase [Egibacteraceae bacterium]